MLSFCFFINYKIFNLDLIDSVKKYIKNGNNIVFDLTLKISDKTENYYKNSNRIILKYITQY